ncbi:MAG: DUF86 domain-containing protein [Verrucomicrobia bacterium]|nr:DUF86 domain-containing protein [Verrucomicrobiota bacterium]MCF7707419.1 DUF86 domain-containing protein [Verrucomicrobiota bacterium]
MQHDPRKHLTDALYACEAIVDFTQNINIEEYKQSLMLRSAVERQFEILGEAFSRLDTIAPEYRDQCPEMGRIIGMRNRIIHGYDTVDDSIVWDAIKRHIPLLLNWLRDMSL